MSPNEWVDVDGELVKAFLGREYKVGKYKMYLRLHERENGKYNWKRYLVFV